MLADQIEIGIQVGDYLERAKRLAVASRDDLVLQKTHSFAGAIKRQNEFIEYCDTMINLATGCFR